MTEELEAQPTPEPVQSMDDFMGDAIDAIAAEEAPEATTAPVADTPEPVEAAPEPETEAAPEELAPANAELKPDDAEKIVSDEPGDQTITAPQSMKAEDREAFYALPTEQQKFLSDRMQEQEASFTKKSMELAEQRKSYDKFEQIIAPRRQELALNGMDESTALGQLFALSDFANKDPLEFTRYLLNQRGIPVTALTEPSGQATADPQLQAVMSELNGLKTSINQQQTQAQDVQGQAINTAIEEFANDKAFPFYSDLENEMIPLVASLRKSQPGLAHKDYLAKAYKAAMSLNDEVSAKVAADNKAKTEAARIAKAKKDADKAKKSAGTRTKSGGTLPAAAAKAKDVDGFIGALVDERMTA